MRLIPSATGVSCTGSTCSNVSLANAVGRDPAGGDAAPDRHGVHVWLGVSRRRSRIVGTHLVGRADERTVGRRAVQNGIEVSQLTQPQPATARRPAPCPRLRRCRRLASRRRAARRTCGSHSIVRRSDPTTSTRRASRPRAHRRRSQDRWIDRQTMSATQDTAHPTSAETSVIGEPGTRSSSQGADEQDGGDARSASPARAHRIAITRSSHSPSTCTWQRPRSRCGR